MKNLLLRTYRNGSLFLILWIAAGVLGAFERVNSEKLEQWINLQNGIVDFGINCKQSYINEELQTG
jgi:hypothetical protein